MDYATYQKIRAYCWQDLAAYLATPEREAMREISVKHWGGTLGEIVHENECAHELYSCRDLTPRERAAAALLAIVANFRAITWRREPKPPRGKDRLPALTKAAADALESQTCKALEEYAAFLPEREAAALLAAYEDAPDDAPAAKSETAKGLSKGQVIGAFQGVYFDCDKWKKYLGSPPDWLKPCRVMKGKQGDKSASATWNPALIAAALLDKGIPIKKLDAVFASLKDWQDEWREFSANDR